jgi:hypothetical protein
VFKARVAVELREPLPLQGEAGPWPHPTSHRGQAAPFQPTQSSASELTEGWAGLHLEVQQDSDPYSLSFLSCREILGSVALRLLWICKVALDQGPPTHSVAGQADKAAQHRVGPRRSISHTRASLRRP